MKPSKPDIEIQSTFDGEEIGLSFDAKSVTHLMTVLTDLYSDPVYAVVREYSTNAYDSHIEAGVDRPIEITCPTPYLQTFKVRDFGTGLSLDEIREVYSKYGASTKRGTNSQVGILGLGCKSALTYTQQFTVTSIKDGRKIVCNVSRDEEGAGKITVIHEEETDEPQGVEVSVPVKSVAPFEKCCEWFFKFWPEGSVLINQKKTDTSEFLHISENVSLMRTKPGHHVDSINVVMGNVLYPVNKYDLRREVSRYVNHNVAVVFWADIGEVDFTPSREQLHYTKKTESALSKFADLFSYDLKKYITDEVSKCSTRKEALQVFIGFNKYVREKNNYDIKFQGELIPTELEFPYPCLVTPYTISTYGQRIQTPHNNIPIDYFNNCLIVSSFKASIATATHMQKLCSYLDDPSHQNYNQVIFTTSDKNEVKGAFEPWLSDPPIVDWKDVPPLPRKSAKASGYSMEGKYRCIDKYGRSFEMGADELNKSKYNILYVRTSEGARDSKRFIKTNDVLVVVGANRQNKFRRLVPSAKEFDQAMQDRFDVWYNTLTYEQQLGLAARGCYDVGSFNYRAFLNTSFDKDENVVRLRKALKNEKSLPAMNLTPILIKSEIEEKEKDLKQICRDLRKIYPLMSCTNPYVIEELCEASSDHLDFYIQSVYEGRKKNVVKV